MIWTGTPKAKGAARFLETRRLLTVVLAGALVWSLTGVDWGGGIIHTGGGNALKEFFLALFPPELSPTFLRLALSASWQTAVHAVAGITLAIIIGLPMGVAASGTLATPGRSRTARFAIPAAVRFVLAFMRSIHELVWAVLFVTAFGLSSLAVVLAIAVPYAGILGRIYSELLNDIPEGPLDSLRSTGASPVRVLLYGRIPMALTDMLSYSFYRFECAIRAAAIMSFVGIRGLGYEIQISLNDLLFSQVWTLLLFLIGIVLLVDYWSTRIRRSLNS
ncbi:MAG: ABC transporter permease subunit [Chloroflexi bacterium]|nr:ABC transporter permease subunit [Chloroflexota bacterium]MDA1270843.1 ABC transporter permease subunit [Chloroflexota bacterium]